MKCVNNIGDYLRFFEYNPSLNLNDIGRFGATSATEYNEVTVGSIYLVMGIIIFKNYQAYLIDDGNIVSACPCQLFEPINFNLGTNWHCRIIEKDEDNYPHIQAIFGYLELCNNS